MRRLWLRCSVVLLSLALVSGNAHAEMHLGSTHHEPCPEALDHHAGTDSPHHHQHPKAAESGCCCDCLGCVSAINLAPDLTSFLPAFPTGAIRYGDAHSALASRALVPEPDPPRPITLI